MERLIELLNEYEDSRWEIIDEEEGAEIAPTRRYEDGSIRHCNSKPVMFEKGMFDSYVISRGYGFVKWLLKNDLIEFTDHHTHICDSVKEPLLVYLQYLAVSKNPIKDLIDLLK